MAVEWRTCAECDLEDCMAYIGDDKAEISYDWISGEDDPAPYCLVIFNYETGEELFEGFFPSAQACRDAVDLWVAE